MGGGGGQTGGTVVGGPAPWAASLAGQYQSSAAQAAADAAQQSVNDAINAINRNYIQARSDVQPYRTEGVQALDQLNQYVQLDPYNPGSAPTAPKKYTAADLADQVTKSQIRNYIIQNTNPVGVSNNLGQTFQHMQYNGAGVDDPNLQKQFAWGQQPAGEQNPGGLTVAASNDPGTGAAGMNFAPFIGNKDIQNAVRLELAGELAQQKNATYDTQYEQYQKNLEEWNQNQSWYNQYKAAGPLSSQQISDKISNLPGYQAELTQGLDAIQKTAAAKGLLGSGALLKELSSYGQNTLSKYYNGELDRLAGLAGMGQQAATFSGQNAMGVGQAQAGLYQGLGDTKANASLASGNALAQALLAANQQYQIIGQQDTGGGGMAGIGSVLGGIGSIMGAFCSQTLKKKIHTPSTTEILDKVNNLNLDKWQYKDIPISHLGPYAEEFKEKFGVGDGYTLNMIDVLGVALASIQELSKQIEELKKK